MPTATHIDTQFTPEAEAFIRRLYRFVAGPEAGFQLKVAPGGCSGFTVEFDLVETPEAGDFIWQFRGLRVFLDLESCRLLKGATVDFVESRSQTGLVVQTSGAIPAACGSASQLVTIAPMGRC